MPGQDVNINGVRLVARASGTLWWPEARLLCVSDLHLGKSERMARRRDVLLPPYDSTETLERLGHEVAELDPAQVVCLGDSFDDDACAGSLPEPDAARLGDLMEGRDWVWIEGNHDGGHAAPGGHHARALDAGGLVFRHQAVRGAAAGEVSGHYHPKIRLRTRGGSLVRKCFVADEARILLPAFGAYTGGLWCNHPAFDGLFTGAARAILAGSPCVAVPLSACRHAQSAHRQKAWR
jgi:uncharacterized protein